MRSEATVNMERHTIGQLAKSFGVATTAIRFYEDSGILPRPARTGSGYRIYGPEDYRRLQLVLRARSLGMELDEIKELVEFASTGTCDDFRGEFRSRVSTRLNDVDRRISELKQLREELRRVQVHLESMTTEEPPDHTLVQCTPESCTCLGPISSQNVVIVRKRRYPNGRKPS
ncbi:MAG: MerR family transcriptional regulator [Chloroflexi bacterium]|nr:MerR family transcriptional regulator [Chloroflexota bacterium]